MYMLIATPILLKLILTLQVKQLIRKYKNCNLHERRCSHTCTIFCLSLHAGNPREIYFANG